MRRNHSPSFFTLPRYFLTSLLLRTFLLFILSLVLLTTTFATECPCSCDTPGARFKPDDAKPIPTDNDDMLSPSPDMLDDVTPTPDIDDMETPTPEDSLDPIGVTDEEVFQDECFGDSECSDDEYCSQPQGDERDCILNACELPPRKCMPRSKLDAPCDSTQQCDQGLYCNFGTGGPADPSCKPRVGEGKACGSATCQEGLSCTSDNPNDVFGGPPDNFSCKKLKKVGEGEVCNSLQECDDESFCDQFNLSPDNPTAICKKKIALGQPCSSFLGNEQCLGGFCALGSSGSAEKGICFEYGVACNCAPTDFEMFPRRAPEVCNRHKGPFGPCINETSLIKTLGAPCNLKNDVCDGRRGLVCEVVGGQPICVQRGTIANLNNPSGGAICTPGSPISTCALGTVCRRALALNTKTPYRTSQCLSPLEIAKQGEICNSGADVICEDGTSCEPGAGIALREQSGAFQRDIIYPVRYCMKTVLVGSECNLGKFDTVCEEGSFCIDGVCTKASSPATVPIKFGGFNVECSKIQCAPGLACQNDSDFGKICKTPEIIVGLGEECFDDGRGAKKCEKGLVCKPVNASMEASGMLKCGPKAELGERCDFGFGSICKEGLKCATATFSGEDSICVEADGLKAGANCNPSLIQCGLVTGDSGPEGPEVLLKCLPKDSSFACQFEKQLFDVCSTKENKACASSLTCDAKTSICLPAA